MDCPYLPPLRTTCSTNDDSSAFSPVQGIAFACICLWDLLFLARLFQYNISIVLVWCHFESLRMVPKKCLNKSNQGRLMFNTSTVKNLCKSFLASLISWKFNPKVCVGTPWEILGRKQEPSL